MSLGVRSSWSYFVDPVSSIVVECVSELLSAKRRRGAASVIVKVAEEEQTCQELLSVTVFEWRF